MYRIPFYSFLIMSIIFITYDASVTSRHCTKSCIWSIIFNKESLAESYTLNNTLFEVLHIRYYCLFPFEILRASSHFSMVFFYNNFILSYNWKIFIVAWITYIYVWQRFERHFSHHWEKWIDLFPLYIVFDSKISFIPIWIHSIYNINTLM